jgi:hypothetical protein
MRRRDRPQGPIRAPLAIAAGVLLAACVSDNRPETCQDSATTIELRVTATAMEPSSAAACRGQDVTLIIRSDVDGVFHVHGLDELVPATTIDADEETTLEFVADRSGQFPVDLHPPDDPQGVTIGLLTLHER